MRQKLQQAANIWKKGGQLIRVILKKKLIKSRRKSGGYVIISKKLGQKNKVGKNRSCGRGSK